MERHALPHPPYLSPFVEQAVAPGKPPEGGAAANRTGGDPAICDAIEEQNLALARSYVIPDSVRLFVDELADEFAALPDDAPLAVDPYLFLAAQRALIGSLRALESEDEAAARRQLRVRLEQIRQVFRDLAEGGPLYEQRSPKEIARWLIDVLDAPQARIAEVFHVSPRTFQRWISETDPVSPEGDDARRVRIIAAVVNHLRHAMTGPGVLAWFREPHPSLGGKRPQDLLERTDALTRLSALAASTRSHTAA